MYPKEFPNFVQRVTNDLKRLMSVSTFSHDLYGWITEHVFALKSDNLALGFRKLIIVLTKSGKLFGIESDTGNILWSHFVNVKFYFFIFIFFFNFINICVYVCACF